VHITTHEPTRRTAFKFGTAALIVGFGIPALASAATNPDAELIALCDRFTAVRNASISLDTIEDDAIANRLWKPWTMNGLRYRNASTCTRGRSLLRAPKQWRGP
jgi:hypothetical protein